MKRNVLNLLTAICFLCCFDSVAHAEIYPPISKKFCGYGDSQKIHTELQGTIMAINGSDLFVNPDSGYMNLAIEGNRRRPKADEGGGDFYSNNISATETITVMKLETYGVGTWPDSGGSSAPMIMDGGINRPVRAGDHIRISGLYVTDNAHSMFYNLCTDSFSYMRGAYKSCYAHTELHPYDYSTIQLIPTPAVGSIIEETHTVVAPVYYEYYSGTYFWNKLWGMAGKLVDASKHETSDATWVIAAPPIAPGGIDGKTHILNLDEQILSSPYNFPVYQKMKVNNGYQITVSVKGSDINNPAIFQAKYKEYWVPILAAGSSYLGCYKDDSNRQLPVVLIPSGATIESCIAAAQASHLLYAGIQYGGQCFGGNTMGNAKVEEAECNMVCDGNKSEICGGTWRNGIYSTGLSLPQKPPTSAYKGCYKDYSSRQLPISLISAGATIESCVAAAQSQNLLYAGLQYYGQCFGGNTIPSAKVSDNECNTPCSADKTEMCGGLWHNSVYSTQSGGGCSSLGNDYKSCGSNNCVNLQNDSNNCGSCGNVCFGQRICSAGKCIQPTCGDGKFWCNKLNICSPVCNASKCEMLSSDGVTCAPVCGAGWTCSSGTTCCRTMGNLQQCQSFLTNDPCN